MHYNRVLWTLFPHGIGGGTQGVLHVCYASTVQMELLDYYSIVGKPLSLLCKELWMRAPSYVSPFCPQGGGLESVTCHFGDPNGPRPPPPSGLRTGAKAPSSSALRPGAASVCLLSMTFLLGASRLGFFVSLRLFSAWGASVSGVD